MKLSDYLGHVVRVKTKDSSTYVGFVEQYHDEKESLTGSEEIVIGTGIRIIPIINIEEIDFVENREIKQTYLLTAEDISNELKESVDTIVETVGKIDHTEYKIGQDKVMYDLNTSFKVAAELGKYNMFEWICDKCGDYLNDQEGFDADSGSWTCSKCGHENIFTKEKIQ